MQERVPRTIKASTQDVPTSAWRPRRGLRIVIPGRLLDGSISDQSVRAFAAVAELDYTIDGCYMAVTNLADRLGIDRGTMHRCLKELATSGFIYRTRTRDGRESWKVRPFAMSPKAGGYALVWPNAVRRIVSARHFRAYALAVREHDRPHGRDITAALIAGSLVNLGTSAGRERREAKRCSPDTAQRALDDLCEAGWLTAERNRPGLPNLYTPQPDGAHEVTRDFRSKARRAERAERQAALDAERARDEQQDGQREGEHQGTPEQGRDVQDGRDAATREGASGGPASDVERVIHNQDEQAPPDGDAPPVSGETSAQVTDVSPSEDVHSSPQREHTVTGGSHDDLPQRCDSPSPQRGDEAPRNGAPLEELARRASSEHPTDVHVIRNGAVVDARASDDDFGDHDESGEVVNQADGPSSTDGGNGHSGRSAGERPSPAAPPSSAAAAGTDPAPPAPPSRRRSPSTSQRPAPGDPGRTLGEILEAARENGPATRPGRYRPGGRTRGAAVTVAELRRRLAGVERAHTPPGGPPRRQGRRDSAA